MLKSCESYKSIQNNSKSKQKEKEKEKVKSKFEEGGKNLWILKPVGLNRG